MFMYFFHGIYYCLVFLNDPSEMMVEVQFETKYSRKSTINKSFLGKLTAHSEFLWNVYFEW